MNSDIETSYRRIQNTHLAENNAKSAWAKIFWQHVRYSLKVKINT